ncbi:hypothetical protein HUK48_05090 [Prevotella corporis]|uniref:hypothetical protein n=1 Tax=Prevotella corporis TaxID=28128 RepID=UPI0023F85AD5|nr:hypothetical protein [Prevotella corporis]MDQ7736795.1 hypothetical protein [Prevotella corporis]
MTIPPLPIRGQNVMRLARERLLIVGQTAEWYGTKGERIGSKRRARMEQLTGESRTRGEREWSKG